MTWETRTVYEVILPAKGFKGQLHWVKWNEIREVEQVPGEYERAEHTRLHWHNGDTTSIAEKAHEFMKKVEKALKGSSNA